MSDFTRKIQYLKGLADGMNATDAAAQWDFVRKLVDALGVAAESIDDLFEMNSELNDYAESIDDDLYRLESDFDGEMEDDDEYYEMEDGGETEKAQLRPFPGSVHAGSSDKSIVQYCPHCLHGYRVSLADFLEQVKGYCPNCGEPISIPSCEDADALPFLRKEEPHGDLE